MAKQRKKTVSETLREAIIKSKKTHYRIGKDSNVNSTILDRFISGERAYLRSDSLDKLCESLKLELKPM